MAAVTVSGTVGGVPVSFLTSYANQAGLAASLLAASGTVLSTGGAIASNNTVDFGGPGSVLTGNAAFGTGTGALVATVGLGANGLQGQVYVTGQSAYSAVVAADNANSSVVNTNPFGNLIAYTGAGGNVLLGLTGGNAFQTGPGGQDIVALDGSSNTLTTRGADAVLVGGPSTITAAPGGLDSIVLTGATTLAFINGSNTGVDSISGAANSAIVVAGTGSTSITSGVGPEAFFVDTGAGNVTLNGNLQTNDAFVFLKDAATTPGTGKVVVNNFAAGSAVDVHGYAGAQFTVAAAAGGGSTLLLTDGSSVTFTNVSAATLAATVKPI